MPSVRSRVPIDDYPYPDSPEYPDYPERPENPDYPDYPPFFFKSIRWLPLSLDSRVVR